MMLSFSNMVAIKKKEGFLVPNGKENLVALIDENVDELYILDCSKEFLDGKGTFIYPRSGNPPVLAVMPLYEVNTFKMLFNCGMTHSFKEQEKYLFYHLVQFKKKVSISLLEYVLNEGKNYDINVALAFAGNAKTAEWLIDKGARCCRKEGFGDSTFAMLWSHAMGTGDFSVIRTVIKKGVADYEWLIKTNRCGFLNIDGLIVEMMDKFRAIYNLSGLLKDERVKSARREWRKTARSFNIEEIDILQEELNSIFT